MFLRAALMAHSCQPNCQLAVDDQLQLTVRASCDLPRGTAIYYNYCDLLEVGMILSARSQGAPCLGVDAVLQHHDSRHQVRFVFVASCMME